MDLVIFKEDTLYIVGIVIEGDLLLLLEGLKRNLVETEARLLKHGHVEIKTGLVDIIGLNENEVGWIASALTGDKDHWKATPTKPELWLEGAELIAKETGVRIDLHTPHYSATIENDEIIAAPTFVVKSKVVCGAGDAWNAGDIYGSLHGLPPLDRLILANAVASLYVSSADSSHPSPSEIVKFLERPPLLSGDGTKLLKVQ